MAQLAGVPIPKGVPPWGADEEEEQPGAGTQTIHGPPRRTLLGAKYQSAIWLSLEKQGLLNKGGAGRAAGMAPGSDQKGMGAGRESQVPVAASTPPFYSTLRCYSSLYSCISTSVNHGLAVLGAWSNMYFFDVTAQGCPHWLITMGCPGLTIAR